MIVYKIELFGNMCLIIVVRVVHTTVFGFSWIGYSLSKRKKFRGIVMNGEERSRILKMNHLACPELSTGTSALTVSGDI